MSVEIRIEEQSLEFIVEVMNKRINDLELQVTALKAKPDFTLTDTTLTVLPAIELQEIHDKIKTLEEVDDDIEGRIDDLENDMEDKIGVDDFEDKFDNCLSDVTLRR